jgi:serine protein kinase
MTLIEGYKSRYSAVQDEEMSLTENLAQCRNDPDSYASAAERMLAAIGEREIVDTRNDPRLSRIFGNRVIKRYPAFEEFYGMEEAIAQIVAFFKHAAQGLEERKQILYLLGPVGGGKSSIAERLKSLMECKPIYALKGSPVNESPLGLFAPEQYAQTLESEFKIPRRYLSGIMSPWALKRLAEFEGDISRFRVVRVQPSVLRQIAISKTEPGTRTTRTSPRWWARSISASSTATRRAILTPTAIPAGCAWPTRGCSNSSRCSRRRSRCCIRS